MDFLYINIAKNYSLNDQKVLRLFGSLSTVVG